MGRLFWKILLGFWLTLLVTGSLVAIAVWQHNKAQIEQLEMLVATPKADFSVNKVATILQRDGKQALLDKIERRLAKKHKHLPIFIVDKTGNDLLGRPVPKAILEQARRALTQPKQTALKQVTTPSNEQFLLFIPRRDHPAMQRNPFFPKGLPVLPLLILALGSFLFSAGLAYYITRPIHRLRKATLLFAQGDLDARVLIGQRKDEITALANDFDYMAERIQGLINEQKRLLNDVSHELRSPLARLLLAVELGRQQPEQWSELSLRIEKESQRLDQLVGDLLTLSRLEIKQDRYQYDCVDINGLVEAIIEDARFEVVKENKHIQLTSTGEVIVRGNIELLRRAIENCIRNAIFYTKADSTVDITLEQAPESMTLCVCDQGQGVAEDKLNTLFLPFTQLHEQQNCQVPGYGLGLAIAARAIAVHQGEIEASNREQGGLCICIKLPL